MCSFNTALCYSLILYISKCAELAKTTFAPSSAPVSCTKTKLEHYWWNKRKIYHTKLYVRKTCSLRNWLKLHIFANSARAELTLWRRRGVKKTRLEFHHLIVTLLLPKNRWEARCFRGGLLLYGARSAPV